MSNWQNKSDFEINKSVSMLIGDFKKHEYSEISGNFHKGDPSNDNYKVGVVFDCCNNPSDAWPIILDNGICINSMAGGDFTLWYAHDKYHTNVDSAVYDENPLRAAMIVYLEMNGVKP